MEKGLRNQINTVPTYNYEKLTLEVINKVIQDCNNKYKNENHFVVYTFGTEEQLKEKFKEFDNVFKKELETMSIRYTKGEFIEDTGQCLEE